MDDITLGTQAMLEAAMDARIPVMLVGSPGTGKTATIKALAAARNLELVTVIGSRMDVTDLAGLPHAETVGTTEDGQEIHATVNLAPTWQVQTLLKRRVILFFDEFSNTSPTVRAGMLNMLQDREFPNGLKFPEETIVIGAMNASTEAADGYELDLPTKNRMMFISWNPTTGSWIEGMKAGWGKKVSDEEQDWKIRISDFIADNPTWLHKQPSEATTTDVYGVNSNDPNDMEVFRSAWASRRSWDNLSRVLAHAGNNTWVQDSIAQGTVGYAAAQHFRDWLNTHANATYKLADVLKDPKKVKWDSMTVNDSNMLLRSVVDGITQENGQQVIAVFDAIADAERQALAAPFILDALKALASPQFPSAVRSANMAKMQPLTIRYQEVARKN